MSGWWKVMATLPSHERVLELQDRFPRLAGDAIALWTMGGCMVQQHLTDGLLSLRQCRAAWPLNTRRAADALVLVGLWDGDADSGYRIHNWCKHNSTAREVDAKRAKNKDKVARHRRSKPDGGNRLQVPDVTPSDTDTDTEAAAAAEAESVTERLPPQPRWVRVLEIFDEEWAAKHGCSLGVEMSAANHRDRAEAVLRWADTQLDDDWEATVRRASKAAAAGISGKVNNEFAVFAALPGKWLTKQSASESAPPGPKTRADLIREIEEHNARQPRQGT